ncbi:ABC transporter permease [Microvenator marinus]|uniref:ABC transporter permease n=1 Tax=Microvenator marinus TaxID=2600177 RepID=A0A5B8XZX6_9DELT|nr:FtsX-like permease family protein [Microvenator marinus]QED29643.1 ABC transporter permease [Microvenator marinus]
MLRMAWRNLWRNTSRSMISISAIGLTYAMFLVAMGMSQAMYGQLEDGAAKMAGGEVLIHAKGYWQNQTNDLVIRDYQPLLAGLRDNDSGVVAARVIVDGLLSTSAGNAGVRLQGIEPEVEKEFQDYHLWIHEGEYLDGAENEEMPIVLGSKVAHDLDVKIGDRVVMTTTDSQGEMRRSLFFLRGVIKTGIDSMDSGIALTTVEGAQKALGESVITQVGVVGGFDRSVTTELMAKMEGQELELLTWREAMPDLVGMIELDKQFGNLYGLLIFIVVIFAVMNTFLMVVMERIREFGLLGALGLTPWQIARLVLAESSLLAVVALAGGFVLGLAGHIYLVEVGFDLRDIYSNLDMGGVTISDPIIRSEIDLQRWVGATISVWFMVIASSLYPALKAARLRPSDAMRFYH